MAGQIVIIPKTSDDSVTNEEIGETIASPPEPTIVSSRLNIPEPVLGSSKQHLTQKKFENEFVNTRHPVVSSLSFEPESDPRVIANFVFIIGTAVALMIWSFEGAEGFAMCFWHLIVLPIGCIYTYSYKKMKQEWEKEKGIYNASEERRKMIDRIFLSILATCVFIFMLVYGGPILLVMSQ